jgi:site-specific recombinase XerD
VLFDYLATGQIIRNNPGASTRGPKHVVKKSNTTVLTAAEARQFLDAIPTGTIAGLRDRALIGVMVYAFARVSVVIKMNCPDYYPKRTNVWFALREKGGKRHAVPTLSRGYYTRWGIT